MMVTWSWLNYCYRYLSVAQDASWPMAGPPESKCAMQWCMEDHTLPPPIRALPPSVVRRFIASCVRFAIKICLLAFSHTLCKTITLLMSPDWLMASVRVKKLKLQQTEAHIAATYPH